MRKRMKDVFASADVMFYLREIVVRLRHHESFESGIITDAYEAFEAAAKFVLFDSHIVILFVIYVCSCVCSGLLH